MRKIFFVLIALLLCFVSNSLNAGVDSLSLGASGSFSNYKKVNGEIFLQLNSGGKYTSEFKIGINNRSYTTDYLDFMDVKANSVGIFAEGVVYPFKKYFYAGIR